MQLKARLKSRAHVSYNKRMKYKAINVLRNRSSMRAPTMLVKFDQTYVWRSYTTWNVTWQTPHIVISSIHKLALSSVFMVDLFQDKFVRPNSVNKDI